MHYVFDKADSPLSGLVVDASGGTWFLDHPVIGLLAGRIAYIRRLLDRSVVSPTESLEFWMAYAEGSGERKHIVHDMGLQLSEPDAAAPVNLYLETDPVGHYPLPLSAASAAEGTPDFGDRLADVREAADSPAYLDGSVSAGLLPLLLYREALGREIYPDEVYTDVAFLVGQFGVGLRRGWQEWAFEAERLGRFSKTEAESAESAARMRAFTRSFVLALQDDPFRGVAATERALRDW